MRVVNLTGRPLTFTDGERSYVSYSGRRAKVVSEMAELYTVEVGNGVTIPVLCLDNQVIEELPDPEADVLYVVSGLVAATAGREDVVVPSRTNRDDVSGRVVSASALLIPWSVPWDEDYPEEGEEYDGS